MLFPTFSHYRVVKGLEEEEEYEEEEEEGEEE